MRDNGTIDRPTRILCRRRLVMNWTHGTTGLLIGYALSAAAVLAGLLAGRTHGQSAALNVRNGPFREVTPHWMNC